MTWLLIQMLCLTLRRNTVRSFQVPVKPSQNTEVQTACHPIDPKMSCTQQNACRADRL